MKLLNHKAKGLNNTFYIVDLSTPTNSWWQLRLVDTHQVISTNKTKDGILDSIYTMTKRYKTKETILNVMKKTDYQLNAITLMQRKEEYIAHEFLLEEVEDTVLQAMDKANEVRKPIKPISLSKGDGLERKETPKPLKKAIKKITKEVTTKPLIKPVGVKKPFKKLSLS